MQIDIFKAERQFDIINFSDFDCIKGLIKHRVMVDPYRGTEINRNVFVAGDVHSMNPAVIVLFVALDDLLSKCNLNVKQKYIVERLMDGYTEQDVADMFKQDVSGITKTLNRVCSRVVEINQRQWKYDYVYLNVSKTPFKYKRCRGCDKVKPTTADFFHADPLGKDGYKNKCRMCVSGQ